MKKLFAVLTVACVLIASISANAQIYSAQTVGLSTNRIAGQAATNFNNVIDVRKQDAVAFQLTFQADAATTDALTFVFYRSVDGSTYNTAADSIALAMTGNTAKTVVTNVTTTGYGWLKLGYITNAAATAVVTNLTVKYGIKIPN